MELFSSPCLDVLRIVVGHPFLIALSFFYYGFHGVISLWGLPDIWHLDEKRIFVRVLLIVWSVGLAMVLTMPVFTYYGATLTLQLFSISFYL